MTNNPLDSFSDSLPDSLFASLKQLPTQPGVYQMFNDKDQIIYVGKAVCLKKRVTQYFHGTLSHKTRHMMRHVTRIETIVTRDENEALLLEANLIKAFHPRYNILLRDDKSYPYLYLSMDQTLPRLDFYRGSARKKGRYFGPYPNAGAVRDTLALIQKLFQLRQCSDTFFKHRTRPCLQYQIDRCTAPCVGYVSEHEYREQVQDAVLFLEGKNEAVIHQLQVRLERAAAQLAYEQAAVYRDQIAQLRQIQKQQAVVGDVGSIDVIGAYEAMRKMVIVILSIRGGRVIGSKNFFPKRLLEDNIPEVLSKFIPQYYLNPIHADDLPECVIIDKPIHDEVWIQRALSTQLKKIFRIIRGNRAIERSWKQLVMMNAIKALSQSVLEAKAFATKMRALESALAFSGNISRIDCFDVSHTMGEATIASCVVFDEQGPVKKAYRRFNIHDIQPGDDYGALKQSLMRRYTRLKKASDPLPDLLIVDGGKGQLKQALFVLETLQVSGVFVMGVAKGEKRKPGLEKLILSGQEEPLLLPPDSMALHLIQQIRDEAHRFAITAHRKKRSQNRLLSPLEQIAGIGPKRRQQLLQHFGGQQALAKATVEEMSRVSGIHKRLAKVIYDALRQR